MVVSQQNPVFIGKLQQHLSVQDVHGEYVTLFDETYYRIRHYDALNPFFMTLVSGSNHWLFISTTGGLSAGRVNADHALFPYYTVDKITENSANTGAKAIFLVVTDGSKLLWEPFSDRYSGVYQTERNIYKNITGTSIVFEEINHDLALAYRYAWRTSDTYGFVKTSWLINNDENPRSIELLDGLQNILPAYTTADVQNTYSNLLDAYKFSEIHKATGLGLFSLSSRLTDLAEPSESLRANTVWQTGLKDVTHLLSTIQIDRFRAGDVLKSENAVRGRRGAYFVNTTLTLEPQAERSWHFVAEVDQDSARANALVKLLQDESARHYDRVVNDIAANQRNLEALVTYADGMQTSSDHLSTAHHFANVLYNVMRGGVFANQYHIDTHDLCDFIAMHRPELLKTQADFFTSLPAQITLSALRQAVEETQHTDLIRLCYSYLPLTFSRRHGDPSRPWNYFEINVKKPDGSRKLDYQGNWRDIFQNWEALSYAYPAYIDGMIAVFLNATTIDGYNPYRISRDGVDWEVPEPDNSWANIGYWSDHQIIYLLKLLEVCKAFYPGKLTKLLSKRIFSYANVPYRIKPYEALLKDPYETIEFDWDAEERITERVQAIGADGRLVLDQAGQVVYASLGEKLLSLLLAKLANFVPEGGIWLTTQRPEWNDANNALVGKGLSVVTLGYIRRFIAFFEDLLAGSNLESIPVSSELVALLNKLRTVLDDNRSVVNGSITDETRRHMLDQLGQAGSEYRWHFYEQGVDATVMDLPVADLRDFLKLSQSYVEHSLRANRREDHLYHAYNILHLPENSARVSHLYEMLEGQVAILSSGMLPAQEALDLLEAMATSRLYRSDQHSYMLYPDREVPGFLEKNVFDAALVQDIHLVTALAANGNKQLIFQDDDGSYHFNGDIRNAVDVTRVLNKLENDPAYAGLVSTDRKAILDVFEKVFNHAGFTGRSGTFFAFEGLGSIYWHMVSKLLLATQETVLQAQANSADAATVNALTARYYDIRAGLGFNKSPDVYGAFPTDPYSHTPAGKGAKQPGMTGVVKEEILTRLVELGIVIDQGELVFQPLLFRKQELLENVSTLSYIDVDGNPNVLSLPVASLGFTFCQVPVVIRQSDTDEITVLLDDGRTETLPEHRLSARLSQQVFARNGHVRQITIKFAEST